MEKELDQIALEVLNKNNLEELDESRIGLAWNSFLGALSTPIDEDPVLVFTLIKRHMEAELKKIQGLKGEGHTVDPVVFVSNILRNLELVMKRINSDQKYAGQDGAVRSGMSTKAASYIAANLSDAVIVALEES